MFILKCNGYKTIENVMTSI